MKLLDEITIKNGGRFYLAKDSRVEKDIFITNSKIRITKNSIIKKNQKFIFNLNKY